MKLKKPKNKALGISTPWTQWAFLQNYVEYQAKTYRATSQRTMDGQSRYRGARGQEKRGQSRAWRTTDFGVRDPGGRPAPGSWRHPPEFHRKCLIGREPIYKAREKRLV